MIELRKGFPIQHKCRIIIVIPVIWPYLIGLFAHPCRIAETFIKGNSAQKINPRILIEKLPAVEGGFRSLESGEHGTVGKNGFGRDYKRSVFSDLFRSKIQKQFAYTVVGN